MAKNKKSQKVIAREWILVNRGVLTKLAADQHVGVSYVSMVLNGGRIGSVRRGSARARILRALRDINAPVQD
jgi:hypothetical protein